MESNLCLYSLSPELILDIADSIDNVADLNNLSQTCHLFHNLLNKPLYRRNRDGGSGLQWAARKGMISTAKKLLLAGSDINDLRKIRPKSCPSHLFKWYCIVCKLVVTYGNELHLSALQVACMYGQVDMVEFLLDHGADIHTFLDEEPPPLYMAAMYASTPIVSLLLASGAMDLQNQFPDVQSGLILLLAGMLAFEETMAMQYRRAHTVKAILDAGLSYEDFYMAAEPRCEITVRSTSDNPLIIAQLTENIQPYEVELLKSAGLYDECTQFRIQVIEEVCRDYYREVLEGKDRQHVFALES